MTHSADDNNILLEYRHPFNPFTTIHNSSSHIAVAGVTSVTPGIVLQISHVPVHSR